MVCIYATAFGHTTILWSGIISVLQIIFPKVCLHFTNLSLESRLITSLFDYVRDSRICGFINFEMLPATISSNIAFDHFLLSLWNSKHKYYYLFDSYSVLCLVVSLLGFPPIWLFTFHYGFVGFDLSVH